MQLRFGPVSKLLTYLWYIQMVIGLSLVRLLLCICVFSSLYAQILHTWQGDLITSSTYFSGNVLLFPSFLPFLFLLSFSFLSLFFFFFLCVCTHACACVFKGILSLACHVFLLCPARWRPLSFIAHPMILLRWKFTIYNLYMD